MKSADPISTHHYRTKADHFFQAMKLAADDLPSYATSVALLAVHSAISLNDAVIVGLTGERRKNQDHAHAARDLAKLCGKARVQDRKGVQHLTWLLAQKSDIAYGTGRLDDKFVRFARDKAEKFNSWAYNNFREVLRESGEPGPATATR